MTSNEQKLLDEVMDWFDFHKVASVMKHLKWKWYFDGYDGVPEESDIRQAVRKQFTKLMHENHHQERFVCATAGFEYTVWRDKATYVDVLELKFIVSDWITA